MNHNLHDASACNGCDYSAGERAGGDGKHTRVYIGSDGSERILILRMLILQVQATEISST